MLWQANLFSGSNQLRATFLKTFLYKATFTISMFQDDFCMFIKSCYLNWITNLTSTTFSLYFFFNFFILFWSCVLYIHFYTHYSIRMCDISNQKCFNYLLTSNCGVEFDTLLLIGFGHIYFIHALIHYSGIGLIS